MPEATMTRPNLRPRGTTGRYLYCLISAEDAKHMTFPIEPVAAPNGKGGNRIYTIIVGEVAAVVSDSPLVRYTISKPNLLTHERALEYVMHQVTALPVKYGTVASSQQELVEKFLEPKQPELLALLTKFKNRAEVSVKAMWNREQAFAEAANHSEVAAVRRQIGSRMQNLNQQDKIDLGQAVERALEQMREADAQIILERLTPLAVEVKLNAITLDMLVLNAAFLVDDSKSEEFDRIVDELDDELNTRLRLKYAGPLPPYNFMQLNLTPAEEEE
jgi:hypothetical protein